MKGFILFVCLSFAYQLPAYAANFVPYKLGKTFHIKGYGQAVDLAMSPDETKAAYVTRKIIAVTDLITGNEITRLQKGERYHRAYFLNNNEILISEKNKLTVWEFHTNSIRNIELDGYVRVDGFWADKNLISVTSNFDSAEFVELRSTLTWELIARHPRGKSWGTFIHPEQPLAFFDLGLSIKVYNYETNTYVGDIPVSDTASGTQIRFLNNSPKVIISTEMTPSVTFSWDIETKQKTPLPIGGLGYLSIDTENKFLVGYNSPIFGSKNKLSVWDLNSNKKIHDLHPPADRFLGSLFFSKTGDYLVAANRYAGISFWDHKEGELLQHISPDGFNDAYKIFLFDEGKKLLCFGPNNPGFYILEKDE